MMNATIYHKAVPTFFASANATVDLSEFVKVATIRCASPEAAEEAYVLSQNLDESWLEGGNVINKYITAAGARSTSVGDVVEVDGKFYEVASFGFTLVVVK